MQDPYYTLDTLCPRTSLGYLLKRIYRLAHAQVEAAFDDGEFTFTQWVALTLLRGGLAETASGLAREIGHDTGAMTRVIDQLAQSVLLERRPDPTDRRVAKLSVTQEGEAALKRTTPRVMDIWNLLLADFPRADVDRFIAMLTIMEGKLVRMEADRAGADA